MLWLIIFIAAVVGVHHVWKYLLPVLRVTKNQESWDDFNHRRTELKDY